MNKLEPHSSLPNILLANLPIRLFISPVKILSQSTVARLSFTQTIGLFHRIITHYIILYIKMVCIKKKCTTCSTTTAFLEKAVVELVYKLDDLS